MSAELLREAAALMRERAEAATPGPWSLKADYLDTVTGEGGDTYVSAPLMEVVAGVYDDDMGNAEHIASWPPAVALAVADLLNDTALLLESTHPVPACDLLYDGNALKVARTYLGSAQ